MKVKILNWNYLYFFVFFIIAEVVLISALTYIKNSKIEAIESTHTRKLNTQLKVVIDFYSTTSTILIDEILSQEEIKNLLVDINTSDPVKQDIIRNKLLNILQPTYDRLTSHGFRQLHFHDEKGNSFLRFHSVDNYGDNLFNFRATILETNKTKIPQFGFEEGKILNGFRNVFPIIIDKKFYGTVELSNSFDTFSTTLHKNFPLEFKLLITKEYVDSKVFPELIDKYYKPSSISDLFYEEKYTKPLNKKIYITPNNLLFIDNLLKNDIANNLKTKKQFVKSLQVNKKHYIVTFIPVADFNQTINTYVASYIEDDTIFIEERGYYLSLFFSHLIIIIFIMIYILKYYSDEKDKFMRKAYIDTLTKLYSRAKFNNDISKLISIEEENSYSLIIFDIDHFKYVNDTYGHDVGDIVLEEFAHITKETLRENDMIYRWGGEEFIILIKDASSKNSLLTLANKLRVAIEQYNFSYVGHITSSFGIAQGEPQDTKDTLLKRADQNLYKAKQSGRNWSL
ncbi:MAG: diguanylate cyclase [Arcobacteraceae bacterium]|nr:diguanylate cyclase [Arcobacteraceae bacterium]